MKISQFFDACVEILFICLLMVFQMVMLMLFGWWMVVHDMLTGLMNKVPESLNILLLPIHLIILMFSPFYGLSFISLTGLKESRKRLSVQFQNITDSFGN